MALTDVTVSCSSGKTASDMLTSTSSSSLTEGECDTASVFFLPWFLQGFNVSYRPLHSKMLTVQWGNRKKMTETVASDLILAAIVLIAPFRCYNTVLSRFLFIERRPKVLMCLYFLRSLCT